MSKVTVYNQEGKKVSEVELNPAVFGVEVKPEVVHHAVVVQRANSRQVLAHAKDRSEVRGGGRKPWKQKGTGRARHGSSRSPIWRGGGVTFGPTSDRNFSLKINKKAKKKALLMGLSDKAASNNIVLLDKLTLSEAKTKKVFEVLQNLGLRNKPKTKKDAKVKEQNVLVVLPKQDKTIRQAAKNITKLNTVTANSLNIVDVLKGQKIVMLLDSVKEVENTFAK